MYLSQKHSMEESPLLFSLNIDPLSKSHLADAAKWGRFLAIVGMVFIALIVLFLGVGISLIPDSPFNDVSGFNTGSFRIIIAFYGIVIGVIWFFPVLFLYRFSVRMKAALNGDDQEMLVSSFQNLKKLFRYVGIVTIIVLSLYALILLFALISLAAMR